MAYLCGFCFEKGMTEAVKNIAIKNRRKYYGFNFTPINSQQPKPHTSFNEHTTRSNYGGYLKEDAKRIQHLPLDNFLHAIFGVDMDGAYVDDVDTDRVGSDRPTLWDKVVNSPVVVAKLKVLRDTSGGETARYAPFVSLANQILDELDHHSIRFCRNDNKPVAGSFARRSPDVVVVHVGCFDKTRSVASCNKNGPPKKHCFWWHNILMFNEFEHKEPKVVRGNEDAEETPCSEAYSSVSPKRKLSSKAANKSNKRQKRPTAPSKSLTVRTSRRNSNKSSLASQTPGLFNSLKTVQCASYALEMLAHSGLRDFAFGIYTINAEIRPIYYDRSMIIESDSINIFENTRGIVCLLDAMARSNWGRSKLIVSPLTPPRTPQNNRMPFNNLFSGGSLSLCGYEFTLKNGIHFQHGIIGRGTRVFKVVVTKIPGKGAARIGHHYCAKISWPAKSRSSEIKLVEAAREVANSREDWKSFLNNLPEILIHEDIDIAKLRFDLKNPHQLMDVFWDVFLCHHWLYESVKILHRDMSEGNIMFRWIGDCVYGVLNDFDLSSDQSTEGPPTSNQRTGTAPFMAIDLLKRDPPPRHLYRHDLESLYYIIVSVLHFAFKRGLLARIHQGDELKDTYDEETLDGMDEENESETGADAEGKEIPDYFWFIDDHFGG
ncbi:hypothetical protein DL96DRAFT_1560959 [Flagelloscypha sp. PMI_526]|nr:hypothetical protein DL96DRAFT_1560959 [Flagelloscypha sp. PMI_526]